MTTSGQCGLRLIPLHNGEIHDFVPDFIVRPTAGSDGEFLNTVLETKGYDPLREVKEAAAVRWANAFNADGRFGKWRFRMANSVADVSYILNEAVAEETLNPVSLQTAVPVDS